MNRYVWIVFLTAFNAHAFCFNEAGQRYQIDPLLLRAIALQESSLDPHAVNHNKDSKGRVTSSDYGVMQINSSHIPELTRLGILHSKDDLLKNPCLNVHIGAWILARAFQTCNVNWECLGAYNAGFKPGNPRRMAYARKVFDRYKKLKGYP